MAESESDGACGCSGVHQGDDSLQTMMVGAVEEVAQTDDSGGFAGEVEGQTRRGPAKDAHHGVEFLSAILQVGAGYEEVGGAGGGHSGEEHAILSIPELVRGFRVEGTWVEDHRRHCLSRRNGRGWKGSLR